MTQFEAGSDISIHKGYDQYLNAGRLEDLEEKKEFLENKLEQMTLLDDIEGDEALTLKHIRKSLVEQRLYDNRKY